MLPPDGQDPTKAAESWLERYAEYTDEQIYHGVCEIFPYLEHGFEQLAVLMISQGFTEDQVIEKLCGAGPDDGGSFRAMLKEEDGLFDSILRRALRYRVQIMRSQLHARNN